MNLTVPAIIRESSRGFDSIAVDHLLLTSRRVFFTDEVDSKSCDTLLRSLIALNEEDPDAEIKLFINSPGGEVHSGLAVFDYISMMSAPLTTICVGTAASMGALLFLSGSKARLMMPHSQIMIHDPSFGGGSLAGKKPHELERIAKDLKKTRDITGEIISKVTGKTMKEILRVTKEDSFFNAEEAVEFGLATGIVEKGESI